MSAALLIGLAVAACDPVMLGLNPRAEQGDAAGASITVEAIVTIMLGLAVIEWVAGAHPAPRALSAAGAALAIGVLVGGVGGWLLAQLTRRLSMGTGVEVDWLLAGLGLAAYGAADRLGGYGLLAAAVAGLAWARIDYSSQPAAARPLAWLAGVAAVATLGAAVAGLGVDLVQGSALLAAAVLILRPLTARLAW